MADDSQLTPDDVARVIVLLYLYRTDIKERFWIYVAVKPSQFAAFQAAQKAGQIRFDQFEAFGEVITSGKGGVPPDSITREVALAYKTDPKEFFKPVPDPVGKIQAEFNAVIAEESAENTDKNP